MSLSNHLYQPSQVLSRKYASIHLSNVSTVVDEFLQRQAQIARRAAAPPTPPVIDTLEEPKPISDAYGPQTPQKTHYGAAVVQHGCLTPPITPENEQFGHGHVAKSQTMPAAYPTTPTPEHSSNMQQAQYYYNSYLQPQQY